MKYKVGDKVRVRQDLVVDFNYGREDFVGEMKSFIGKIVTISKVIDEEYMIVEDDGDYAWTEEMFEGFANEAPSITKRINDKHNILNGLLNSGGSVGGKRLIEKLEDNQVQVANGVVMGDRPQRPTKPASTGREEKFKVGDIVQFVRTMSFPSGGYIKWGTVWEITALNDTRYTLLLVDGEEGVKGIDYNINSSLDTINSYCEKVEAKGNDSEEAKTKGSHYEKAAMQPLEVMQRVMTTEQFKGFLYGCCLKYLLRKEYKGQRESDEYKARQYAYWLEMVKEGRIINPSKDKVPFDYKFNII